MIIVVTGNIGCGKSTVADMLYVRLNNPALFDYDGYVRDHLYGVSDFLSALLEAYGTNNRGEVAKIVFSDREALEKLRDIAQPFMDRAMIRFIAKNQRKNMILDIPLWFENQMGERFGKDLIVTVVADEDTQVARVKCRSGWAEERVRAVINNQYPQAIKVDGADYVISNRWGLDFLEQQVDDFIDTFVTKEA